jgi:hypothetical protein
MQFLLVPARVGDGTGDFTGAAANAFGGIRDHKLIHGRFSC